MHWCFRQSLDGNKPVCSEEMLFENVNRRRTDGHRTDADRTAGRTLDDRRRAITIAHPEHMLSWAKNKWRRIRRIEPTRIVTEFRWGGNSRWETYRHPCQHTRRRLGQYTAAGQLLMPAGIYNLDTYKYMVMMVMNWELKTLTAQPWYNWTKTLFENHCHLNISH